MLPRSRRRTEKRSRQEVQYDLQAFFDYSHLGGEASGRKGTTSLSTTKVDRINSTGIALIRTSEMAIQHLERLQEQTGEFGEFLFFANEWAIARRRCGRTNFSRTRSCPRSIARCLPVSNPTISTREIALARRPRWCTAGSLLAIN
jgi:hypothetical protein